MAPTKFVVTVRILLLKLTKVNRGTMNIALNHVAERLIKKSESILNTMGVF